MQPHAPPTLPFPVAQLRCVDVTCRAPLELELDEAALHHSNREYVGCTMCTLGYRLRIASGLVTDLEVLEPGSSAGSS